MKKISVLVAAMLLSVSTLSASVDREPEKSISLQISEMLNDRAYALDIEAETALVRFTLNKEGEIVVLSVDSESTLVASYIKEKLNYQKIELATYQEGKMYKIPVRIAE